jgi:cation diffusion facilitator CzcD-associated flavoprotein CzcO
MIGRLAPVHITPWSDFGAKVRAMETPRSVDVLIVGAGISGIGAAIRLRQSGFDDLVILEKGASVGGTWRDNTYPGCACDVPSALYSYSFAQSASWSRAFAGQAEIERYVRGVAERFDVSSRIRFGEAVEQAAWSESERRWLLTTTRGRYAARFVISCAGYLHEPQIPAIPGLAQFPGVVFHSSRWNHGHDLRGRRLAVIGSGASAIQFVPQIQPKLKQLHLFQRTPQWILPKPDVRLGRAAQTLLRLPGATQLTREFLYRRLEEFGSAFRRPERMKYFQALAQAHLWRSVADPVLRQKLTPDYTLGCKRVLLSNDYYPALTRANVEVLATGVARIEGARVIGHNGEAREVDTLILGTGFHVSDPPVAAQIRGASGKTLAEVWAGSPEAYRGTTIAGFPNAFLVLGPNLAIGHNSAFLVIEAQLAYIVAALTTLRAQGITRCEVRRDAQAGYNRRVQRDLARTVWNQGGCASYYLDANGKNSVAFPWSTARMKRILSEFDLENYHVNTGASANARGQTEVQPHG